VPPGFPMGFRLGGCSGAEVCPKLWIAFSPLERIGETVGYFKESATLYAEISNCLVVDLLNDALSVAGFKVTLNEMGGRVYVN
jgi:hypothetical protein